MDEYSQLAKTSFDPFCFPECTSVQLEDGSQQLICNIKEGDMVLVNSEKRQYSQIIKRNAKLLDQEDKFLTIQTEQGDLPITLNHYIHVRKENKEEVAMNSADVKTGDQVNFMGRFIPVTNITSIISKGRYNPITEGNTLVVNGFLTYCNPPSSQQQE